MTGSSSDDPRDHVIDLEHRVAALETDLGRLADAHRDLHRRLATTLDLLEERVEAHDLALGPPPPGDDDGPRALARRIFRFARRTVKGWLGGPDGGRDRFARTWAEHPVPQPTLSVLAADETTARTLAARQTVTKTEWTWWNRERGVVEVVASGERDGVRPAIDDDEVRKALLGRVCVAVPAGLDLPTTVLEDALLALAVEELELLEITLPATAPHPASTLHLVRRDLWHPLTGVDASALAARAAEHAAVIGRRLALGGSRLPPPGLPSDVLRTTPDGVLLGTRQRSGRHNWSLRPLPPGSTSGTVTASAATSDEQGILVVLDVAPVGGVETLLATLARVAGDRPMTLVTTFASDAFVYRRLRTLEHLATIHHLGELVAPDLRDAFIQRLSVGRKLVRIGPQHNASLLVEARDGAVPAMTGPIPWGIAPVAELDDDTRTSLRAALGVGDGELLVVRAGDLVPAERPEDVVAVAHRLRDLPLRIVSIGAGPLGGTVDDLAAWYRLDSFTRLDQPPASGEHPGLEAVLAAADLVLTTAERVVWPTAVLGALAGGTPVVATEIAGLDRLLSAGPCGVTVPTGDLGVLSDAVRHLVEHPDERLALARATRETAARHPLDATEHALAALLDEP